MELNDGVATIIRGQNTAENGEMPNIEYTLEIFSSYYGEKTIGFTRFFTAKANDSQADLLIEIQRCGSIRDSDICRLSSFKDSGISGDYVIVQVQNMLNDDDQPMTDLTLQRISPIEGVDNGIDSN